MTTRNRNILIMHKHKHVITQTNRSTRLLLNILEMFIIGSFVALILL